MKNTMNRHMKQAIASVILSTVLLSECGGALPGMTDASAEAAGSVAAVQTIMQWLPNSIVPKTRQAGWRTNMFCPWAFKLSMNEGG